MKLDEKLLFSHVDSIINDFYFNQVSGDFKEEPGSLYRVPQMNTSNSDISDYMYADETLKPMKITKRLKYSAATRSLSNKDYVKPLIASVLHEIGTKINVFHFEPHCGKYLKLLKVNEAEDSVGYDLTFESFALPFIKQNTKIESAHDSKWFIYTFY